LQLQQIYSYFPVAPLLTDGKLMLTCKMFANLCNTHLFPSCKLNYVKYTHTFAPSTIRHRTQTKSHAHTHALATWLQWKQNKNAWIAGGWVQSAYIAKPEKRVPTLGEIVAPKLARISLLLLFKLGSIF